MFTTPILAGKIYGFRLLQRLNARKMMSEMLSIYGFLIVNIKQGCTDLQPILTNVNPFGSCTEMSSACNNFTLPTLSFQPYVRSRYQERSQMKNLYDKSRQEMSIVYTGGHGERALILFDQKRQDVRN